MAIRDRLREAIQNYAGQMAGHLIGSSGNPPDELLTKLTEEAIDQIITLFRESKWLEPNTEKYDLVKAFQEAAQKNNADNPMPVFMTGAEWLEKFSNEFMAIPGHIPINGSFRSLVMEAAGRASGVK